MTIKLTTKSCMLIILPLCLSIICAGYVFAIEYSAVKLEEVKQETVQYWYETAWYNERVEMYETIASVFYCVGD